uniref:Solute carrier family 41 member n=1 Tax=Knipowitschia caucasica TaxID=637954 RepID=A0AAV2M2J0_KNICA
MLGPPLWVLTTKQRIVSAATRLRMSQHAAASGGNAHFHTFLHQLYLCLFELCQIAEVTASCGQHVLFRNLVIQPWSCRALNICSEDLPADTCCKLCLQGLSARKLPPSCLFVIVSGLSGSCSEWRTYWFYSRSTARNTADAPLPYSFCKGVRMVLWSKDQDKLPGMDMSSGANDVKKEAGALTPAVYLNSNCTIHPVILTKDRDELAPEPGDEFELKEVTSELANENEEDAERSDMVAAMECLANAKGQREEDALLENASQSNESDDTSLDQSPEPSAPLKETSFSIGLQVVFPFLLAGFGTVAAGMVLDIVQTFCNTLKNVSSRALGRIVVDTLDLCCRSGDGPPQVLHVAEALCVRLSTSELFTDREGDSETEKWLPLVARQSNSTSSLLISC